MAETYPSTTPPENPVLAKLVAAGAAKGLRWPVDHPGTRQPVSEP
jgi:hypothetical protein